MRLWSSDGGNVGEYNGVGFVKTSYIFVMQYAYLLRPVTEWMLKYMGVGG